MKRITGIFLVVFLAVCLVLSVIVLTDNVKNSPENQAVSATVSIYVEDEDRFILPEEKVSIKSGESAFDMLKKVTKENKIQMEFEGADLTAYVEGIDNLYVFDKGEKSGWVYYINGESATVGAASYEVKSGDNIEWRYVTEMY